MGTFTQIQFILLLLIFSILQAFTFFLEEKGDSKWLIDDNWILKENQLQLLSG